MSSLEIVDMGEGFSLENTWDRMAHTGTHQKFIYSV